MAETSPLGLAGMRSLYDRNKYGSNEAPGPVVGQSSPHEEGFYHRGLEADKASAFPVSINKSCTAGGFFS